MLSAVIVVLVLLWALGVATAYTLGGLIHVLPVMALVVMVIRVVRRRNPLRS